MLTGLNLCSAQIGVPGGGGEYEVVDGFGWTNGARWVRQSWVFAASML